MSIRAEIRAMPAGEAVEYLLGVIDEMTAAAPHWVERMSPTPAKIATILEQEAPRIVPYQALIARLYWDRSDDEIPDTMQNLTSQIWRVRRALPEGYAVRSVFGVGYRMECPALR